METQAVHKKPTTSDAQVDVQINRYSNGRYGVTITKDQRERAIGCSLLSLSSAMEFIDDEVQWLMEVER